MGEPTLYDLLQVTPAADPEVIEAAYRKLALKYHPDRNFDPMATEVMKRLAEAKHVLLDHDRRRAYDAELGRAGGRRTRPADGPPVVTFNCPNPKCRAVSETVLMGSGGLARCPRCSQRIRLRPAAVPVGRPVNKGSPISAVLTPDDVERMEELFRLRPYPGNIFIYGGVISCVALTLLGLFLSSALTSRDGTGTARALAVTVRIMVILIFGTSAALWSYIAGSRMNRDYEEKAQPVRVNYQLESGQLRSFEALGDALQGLTNNADVWEGHAGGQGVVRGDRPIVYRKTPRCMDCNLDVYCLESRNETFYFLPDGVVAEYRRSLDVLRYDEVAVRPRRARVYMGEVVVGHRWLYARVDGGPDRRYKGNHQVPIYQSEYRDFWALEFRLGDRDLLFIAAENDELRAVEESFAKLRRLGLRLG